MNDKAAISGHKHFAMYGGAFDPVHITHLALAQCVTDALNLDQLFWVPTGYAWHKQRQLSQAPHRLAMLNLAFEAMPQAYTKKWRVDTVEIEHSGPSYTADTLKHLQNTNEDNERHNQWYVVIGADQFALFHTWKKWQQIVTRCTLAVIGRAGIPLQADAQVLACAKWVHVPFPESGVSSSEARELARLSSLGDGQAGKQLLKIVPAPVAAYIKQHHLYDEGYRNCMDIRKLQRAIVDGLEDVKGQNIVVFNTEELSALFERVIIASANTNRQTKALASSVRDSVKEAGFPVPRSEGEENGEWIIVDCGAAVVHIMQPAIRAYYRLEEIWGEKPVRIKLIDDKKPKTAEKIVEKPATKKVPVKKAPAKKTVAKKVPAKKAAKTAAVKVAASKALVKKVASKTAVKKTASKAASKKASS